MLRTYPTPLYRPKASPCVALSPCPCLLRHLTYHIAIVHAWLPTRPWVQEGQRPCLVQHLVPRAQHSAWSIGGIQWIILLNGQIHIHSDENRCAPERVSLSWHGPWRHTSSVWSRRERLNLGPFLHLIPEGGMYMRVPVIQPNVSDRSGFTSQLFHFLTGWCWANSRILSSLGGFPQ